MAVGLFSAAATAVLAADDALPSPPSGYKWVPQLEVSDEFEGDSLDKGKWRPKHPFWTGRDSRFLKSNVSVKDGSLRLRSSLKKPTKEVDAKNVTAACVSSNDPICRPGFYQARVKASALSMTSSFWFQGEYSEIDVIENTGSPSNPDVAWMANTMMMNTHYYIDGWENDIKTPEKWEMPELARDAFQVFGVWWKEDGQIIFYYNGEPVAEVQSGGDFDEGMYMYFDTEVFKWNGWPTKDSLLDEEGNTMLVDWVRGWKLAKL